MSEKPERLDLAAVRELLAGARGRDYWRSLEQLAGTPGFQDLLHREFPRQASEWTDGPEGRRNFLRLMGASLALAGLSACTRQPTEHIMPYVRQPEDLLPGKPLFFATAHPLGGIGTGLLMESHEGRPTKAEGNPEHPASLGACDVFSQAQILALYDPDRARTLGYEGDIRSWPAFLGAIRQALAQQRARQGAGLRILTEPTTSPTLGAQMAEILKALPAAKWHVWDPVAQFSARAGAQMAFGRPINVYYDLQPANVIVSLDADILGSGPASLRYARQFAARRRVRGTQAEMNRLYVAEPMPTPTGTRADHRFPLRAADIEAFAWALAQGLGAAAGGPPPEQVNYDFYRWVGPLVRDLQNNKGAGLIVAGDAQPPAVHALAHVMNQALGNIGRTVFYTDPLAANPVDPLASLHELVRDLDAGAVDLLLILGGNPVYTAPVELGLRDRIRKARTRVHLSLYEDETSELCQWQLPRAHFLEAWSDTRAYDGTVTIMQPLIEPLYGGRSDHEVLAMLTDQPERRGYEIVRDYWRTRAQGDFETWWRRAVHDGVVPNTALPHRNLAPAGGWKSGQPSRPDKLEIVFRPDASVHDGSFANNGWLQELPRPITTVTWDNPAILSPATAQRFGLQTGDLVELSYLGRKVRAPVFVQPGHANGSVTVQLGYGRTRAGRVGTRIGWNAYGLRTSTAMWRDWGLELRKLDDDYPLAVTQGHHVLDARRNLVRHTTLEEYRKNPNAANEHAEAPAPGLTLYPDWKYEGYAWGMAIDMTACTGCQACVIACVAENNIPVVGKDQVRRGREMHWLRVDSYYLGGMDNPEIYNQPVPCMHCETAPCELVCPVQATAHSAEGLNDMVYNRCIGTRYCSNNCPYKVRRFNFLSYNDWDTPSLKLGRNPDVTVRARGVMEKCTYCVQRINYARIEAEKEGRKVRDGEVQTACQAACPAEAIVFGDINDAHSQVARLKAEKLNYGMLEHLNTRPRTTYLAALRNPNPEIEA